MAKGIPGWLYMIAGVAIMAYTRFILSRQPQSKIGFFFWVGVAFLVIGILKEVIPRVMAKKEKKEPVGPPKTVAAHHSLHPQYTSPHVTHQHVNPQQHPSHPYQPLHKQCPRCHQLTGGTARYCHSCGHQFF